MWKIVWPLIVTNILSVVVGMVDFKMVGVLGVEAIAAVGMARQVMMFLQVLIFAISAGASVVIAHAFGAGDQRRVSEVSAQSAVLLVAASVVIITPVGILSARPFLTALGGNADVVRLGGVYLTILFAGSVFTMFNFAVSGVLLGVGRTRVSLFILLGVNLLNIVLNYLLINGIGPFPALSDLVVVIAAGYLLAVVLGMGFAGIAVAIAMIAATRAVPVSIAYRRGRWKTIRV